jgi:uncharacterized phiE125 gp8 family phage protein
MTWSTDELGAAELGEDGGVPIAVAVTLAESGDDTFSAAVTQPQGSDLGEPLTLAEAKRAARIDDVITEFDDLVARSVTAARLMAEQETGRDFVRKTRRVTLKEWPAATDVLHVHEPVDLLAAEVVTVPS